MITEKDLVEAIAECQGVRNPNANTCIKLAAFYTILNEIRGKPEPTPVYSFEASPPADLELDSDTEFARVVSGRKPGEVLPIMDELMTALSVLHPRLYQATMEKIEGL